MGSSRLPQKVIRRLAGTPMIERVIERVRAARRVDRVVLAVPDGIQSAPLRDVAVRLGVDLHVGSEDDVLGRVAGAARTAGAGTVVALTGDNPFVDPALIDDVLDFHQSGGFDYSTTSHMDYAPDWPASRSFPRGVSVQAVSVEALLAAADAEQDPEVREHSTYAVYAVRGERHRLGAFAAEGAYAAWRAPGLRLTVDTAEDFQVAERVWNAVDDGSGLFSTGLAIAWLLEHPEVAAMNGGVEQRRPRT